MLKIRKEFQCMNNEHCINRCYVPNVSEMSCYAKWQVKTHCPSFIKNWKKDHRGINEES